jgi:hypothetical protein
MGGKMCQHFVGEFQPNSALFPKLKVREFFEYAPPNLWGVATRVLGRCEEEQEWRRTPARLQWDCRSLKEPRSSCKR